MGYLRIRKVRSNDANGMCRRETIPANPVFRQRDVNENGHWHSMCSANELSICMAHLLRMLVGVFALGMLDPTPVSGDAGVLRKFVVQILRSVFKFCNNYSGRAEYTLVRGSTNRLEPSVPQGFSVLAPAPRHTQNTKSTRNHPSGPPLQ